MECRSGCGACCIALSISSPIPGMPNGKPAGVPCVQLDEHRSCKIFHSADRPEVCAKFLPAADVCGDSPEAAMQLLQFLEQATR